MTVTRCYQRCPADLLNVFQLTNSVRFQSHHLRFRKTWCYLSCYTHENLMCLEPYPWFFFFRVFPSCASSLDFNR